MVVAIMSGIIAGAAAAAAVPAASGPDAHRSFALVELRQYTLHDGRRDELISLFEREFVESQEAVGMEVIGTFTDLDRPNRFVWLRGYRNMDSRLKGLTAFYGGPVWREHSDAANATMIDSDDVLLLRAPSASAAFALPATRPALGETAPAGLIVATIYYLKVPPAEAVPAFETRVKPTLERAGIQPLAWFVTESAPNNFPRLPVREGEKVLVWFAAFADEADHRAHQARITEASAPLRPLLARGTETLRLKPTTRSLLRVAAANAPADGAHDFDFLHGRWKVKHRVLKSRGTDSKVWIQYAGTADTRPLLGGLCNIEEHRISGRPSGIALRCYDPSAKRWAIYWVSEQDGLLGLPVYGMFHGSEGLFEGDDVHDGRPVKVRFVWRKLSPSYAHWEQAFSFDSGKSWETNWVMDFERAR